MTTQTMRPTSVRTLDPQAGQDISVVGDTYRIIADGIKTGGTYAVIDMLVPPGGGPGPHAHTHIQESFYVIDGEVVVRSDTQTYTAKKGAFIDIPTGGAVHSFTNESTATAHVLCTVVPSGIEQFFVEVGKPVAYGEFLSKPVMGPDEQKKMKETAQKYGQELFPPDYFTR